MSDTSQGDGWWLASDDKWYPPQPTQPQSPELDKPLWRRIATRKIWILPVWAYVLVALVVSAALGGGGTTDQQTATGLAATVAPTSEPAPAPTATAAPAPTATAVPQPTTAPAPQSSVTVSQQNAVGSAESYLRFSNFSRQGLIEQLEYEGFSVADATYAVDTVTVDWSAQAVGSAESYLDFSTFSCQGLIDQLVYEGFSQGQAQYGAGQTGIC